MDLSFKRIAAYLIDFFIVSLVASMLVTLSGYSMTNEINNNSYEKLMADYNDKKITDAELEKAMIDLNYNENKDMVVINVVTMILLVGYFGVYQVIAKGQTIGKKLLKIKVVQKDDSPLTYFGSIIRTVILTNIFFRIFLILGLYFLNAQHYYTYSYVISMIQGVIQVTIFIMVILRQDGRGLHDFLAKTKVVASEVKLEDTPEVKTESPKETKKTIEALEKPKASIAKKKTTPKTTKKKTTKNTKE